MPLNTFLSRLKSANAGTPDVDVLAYGSGVFVSGAVTVATGLSSVNLFQAQLTGTGAKTTGAAEGASIQVHTITTGSVVLALFFNSFVTGTPTISVSGTNTFAWFAIGTP